MSTALAVLGLALLALAAHPFVTFPLSLRAASAGRGGAGQHVRGVAVVCGLRASASAARGAGADGAEGAIGAPQTSQ